MTKKCVITGKKKAFGKNVSHANNKTCRSFDINIHKVKVFSSALNELVSVKVTAAGLRSIHRFGFDALIKKNNQLSRRLNSVKKRIIAAETPIVSQ